MAQNLEALRQAAVIYPIFAVLFTVPYLLYCYRKYGSVLSLRIVIVYSFALYLLCVYCLVILPLPSAEKARTRPRMRKAVKPMGPRTPATAMTVSMRPTSAPRSGRQRHPPRTARCW